MYSGWFANSLSASLETAVRISDVPRTDITITETLGRAGWAIFRCIGLLDASEIWSTCV